MELDDHYIKLYFGVSAEVRLFHSNLLQKVTAFINGEKKLQEALECLQSDTLEETFDKMVLSKILVNHTTLQSKKCTDAKNVIPR